MFNVLCGITPYSSWLQVANKSRTIGFLDSDHILFTKEQSLLNSFRLFLLLDGDLHCWWRRRRQRLFSLFSLFSLTCIERRHDFYSCFTTYFWRSLITTNLRQFWKHKSKLILLLWDCAISLTVAWHAACSFEERAVDLSHIVSDRWSQLHVHTLFKIDCSAPLSVLLS